MLTKNLVQIGDSVGLIFDKPILKQMDLAKGDTVGVEFVEGKLVISRVKVNKKSPAPTRSRSARMDAIRAELHANLGSAFRKLAK